MAIAYVFLAMCIALNLLSCSLLTASDGFTKPVQSISGIVLAILNYFMLSRCIAYINISIAYAIWAGVGIIISVLISVFFFKQHITRIGVISACLIAFGLVFIHLFGTM